MALFAIAGALASVDHDNRHELTAEQRRQLRGPIIPVPIVLRLPQTLFCRKCLLSNSTMVQLVNSPGLIQRWK